MSSQTPPLKLARFEKVVFTVSAASFVAAIYFCGRWANYWYVAQAGLRPHAENGDVLLWQDLFEMLSKGNWCLVWAAGYGLLATVLFILGKGRARRKRRASRARSGDSLTGRA